VSRQTSIVLAAALVGLSACIPSAGWPGSASGRPVLWCSGELANGGKVSTSAPPGPYRVELLPDGSVRSLEHPEVAGFPSRGALSLHASTDVEVHLSNIDGPVIAIASPGRRVDIVTYGEEVTEVLLKGSWGNSGEAEAQDHPAVRLFVRTAGLALEAKKGPPVADGPHPIVKGILARVYSAPAGIAMGASDGYTPVRLVGEAREPAAAGGEPGARWLRVEVIARLPYDRKDPPLISAEAPTPWSAPAPMAPSCFAARTSRTLL
jgi:hypothetical protein